MKKPKRGPVFSTDAVMTKVYKNLYSDFLPYLESKEDIDSVNRISDIPRFREHRFDPKRLYRNVGTFKRSYQLENLFKRYRFSHDKFDDKQLEEETCKKFVSTQNRVATLKPFSFRASLVIKAARRHVCRILKEYDSDEHMACCRFGLKAAVGHPSSRRYLDLKAAGDLTGSQEHISWFKRQLDQHENYLLKDVLYESKDKTYYSRFMPCDALNLTNVPKTFKTLRSIMANTLLGGFYSYGLGKVIQNRLVPEGLNIRYLQDRHRHLVLRMSQTRRYVTADLSAASDSFTAPLVMSLLPRKWWHAVNLGRIRYAKINGTTVNLASFMTMGIGFTFQLQTLLFYCLIRGVQDCLGRTGFVSVYGDDLIYPTTLHPYIVNILTDLGFILNEDKTFVTENFRESCGADAYCGCDVRPFQPEGQSQYLPKTKYVCFLYKTINGLRARWKESEIQKTLNYLYGEILLIDGHLLQVPPLFPDNSGVRTSKIQGESCWHPPIWNIPVIAGRYQNLCFPAYKTVAKTRSVISTYIYYWDKLRSSSNSSFVIDPFDPYGQEESLLWKKVKAKPYTSLAGDSIKYRMKAYVNTDRYNIVRQQSHAVAWSEDSMSRI